MCIYCQDPANDHEDLLDETNSEESATQMGRMKPNEGVYSKGS
jgi:hypothetical protein